MKTKTVRILEAVRALSTFVRGGDELARRLRIKNQPGGVEFSAYGKECGGQILIDNVDSEAMLDAIVDLTLFEKILSAADSENVQIDVDKTDLRFSFERAVMSVPLLTPDGYTSPPHKDLPVRLRIRTNLSALKTGLYRVEYLTSPRAQVLPHEVYGKYVFFDFDVAGSEFVPLVALERRRMAVHFLPVHFEKENLGGKVVILPNTIEMVIRAVRAEEGQEVVISASQNVALFRTRNCEAFTVVANTIIPDWSNVIENVVSRLKFEAKVPVRDMRSALRQIAPVIDPEYRRVEIVFGPGRIVVRSRNMSRGEIVVDADCSVEEPSRILLDHRLLSEYVESCHSLSDSEIRVRFGDPHDALAFTNGDFTHRKPNEYRHVLMPMRDDPI